MSKMMEKIGRMRVNPRTSVCQSITLSTQSRSIADSHRL